MASKDKVSMAQLRVGILAIVALSCIVLLIFLLTGNKKFFITEVPLHTYVDDAASLQAGAAVRIAGIQAGTVKKVALSGSNDPRRVIRVDFEVDQDMLKDIPVDSVISISSDNLLGSTKFLNIKKGQSPQTVKAGAELPALDTRQFDELVQQGYTVLGSLQGILQQVQTIVGEVESGKGTIGKFLVDDTLYKNLNDTIAQLQSLVATLNSNQGTIGKLVHDDAFYNDVRTTLGRFDSVVQGIQAGQGSAGKFIKDPALYNDLHASVTQLNTLLANLNSGKGTAGQLLTNERLSNQISDTLTKIDTTIDKINSGQGTLGQLMVNPQLYDSLNGTTRELHELLKDFRANPKKFLRIQLHLF
ncbi:MAG TPA: MlaD family protein [Bryobacteraceae bacterium]|jgi:phospholipid/cholesterol/gamma-HCH transport system substrate-binding protein|nr:MlaD family protein [Bryobacteraceae bacterium]